MEGNVSLPPVLLNGGKEMYIKHFQKFVTKFAQSNNHMNKKKLIKLFLLDLFHLLINPFRDGPPLLSSLVVSGARDVPVGKDNLLH